MTQDLDDSDDEKLFNELAQTIAEHTPDLIVSNNIDVMAINTIEDGETTTTETRYEDILVNGTLVLDSTDEFPCTERFDIKELIGSGGSGAVYELQDNNLRRSVAIKFLSTDNETKVKTVKRFMHEALITSYLEHPNIPPVYNLDIQVDNKIYYIMKKINGKPLSRYIKQGEVENADDVAKVLSVFLKVCDAVAYAHSRNVIHRDIKPDNVMVGDYGEVYLVDWGIALDVSDDKNISGSMSGTPMYMSPEQARKEQATKSSDIYCLGTTFYHVLSGQFPYSSKNVEMFWEHKRKGILNLGESKTIPKPLLAICKKCMAAKPQDRYPDIQSLISELRIYQSGGMVDTYQYSLREYFRYHLKKSSKHFVWVAVLLIFIAAAVYGVYKNQQRQIAGWGDPIFETSFNDDKNWKDDWLFRKDRSDAFAIEDGRLIAKKGPEFTWLYKHKIKGSVAIEFEGESLPDSKPGDLSIIHVPDLKEFNQEGKSQAPTNAYYLQLGALSNTCTMIDGPVGRLNYSEFTIENGQKYKIRAEIDGKRLRLYVDDVLLNSHDLITPIDSGYIGLYAYFDNKAFDNIKIYNKELPEITDITKTIDILFQHEQFETAAEHYERISRVHAGTDTANYSLYKLGLCNYHLGKHAEAVELWDSIDDPYYDVYIYHYRWMYLIRHDKPYQIIKEMEQAIAKKSSRERIILQWVIFLKKANDHGYLDMIDKLLAMRSKYFPDNDIFVKNIYDSLVILGRADKAIEWFPKHESYVLRAMSECGRYKEIMERVPEESGHYANALRATGQYEALLKWLDEYGKKPEDKFGTLLNLGRIEEAKKLFGKESDLYDNIILFGENNFKAIEDMSEEGDLLWTLVQLYLENEEGFLIAQENHREFTPDYRFDARMSLALKRYIQGDKSSLADMREYIDNTPGYMLRARQPNFEYFFLYPILEHFNGNEDVFKKAMRELQENRKWYQGLRPWYCSKLATGSIDKDYFMKQPTQTTIDQDYLLYQAVNYDLRGRAQHALELYQEFLVLPPYKKTHSATISRYVKYRIATLSQK